MVRRGVLVALVAVVAALSVQTASADPTKARSSLLITAVCGDRTVQLSVNGEGEFTPGHVVGSSAVLVPTAFDTVFSFTPTGGETMSETDTSAKRGQKTGGVTCQLPEEQNTFVSPEGTFSISGTVTGFFTPAAR